VGDASALALACCMARAGCWDLRLVVVDGVGVTAGPVARSILNYYGMDFVPVVQFQGSNSVASNAAPNIKPR
jgi:hypothetical protein